MMLLPLPQLCLLLLAATVRPALPAPSGVDPGPAQCLEGSCYRLFWGRKDFAGAQRQCRQPGGRGKLMSVRSSVSAEVISLLLQQSPGRLQDAWLWIGLRREQSQPCPSAGLLRGFHWVTGNGVTDDDLTDYANWRDPAGPCGERCTAVLSDGRWEERDCAVRGQGFLCEYSYPGTCSPLAPGPGQSVSYSLTFGLEGSDFMALPPQTVVTLSPMGLQLWCQGDDSASMRWASQSPGPWDCQVENGGCEHTCLGEEEGTATCHCPPGKQLAEDGRSCTLPPDPCASHGCQQLCFVNTTDHAPQCMCHEGFELAEDGTSCQDVDDCRVNKNICDQQCQNTVGGFSCLCYQGYEMGEDKCEDIDECLDQVCEQGCENLPGTYRCYCDPGYMPDPGKPNKCQIFCNASECPAECDPHTQESCRCPPGYILDIKDAQQGRFIIPDDPPQRFCEDIDECLSGYCQHTCHNTPGSFRCSCEDGFTLQEDQLLCKPDTDDDGSSDDVTTTTPRPTASPQPTASPPEAIHLGVLVGIIVGIVSMVAILLAIAFHLIKKHTVHTDYKCKSTEKAMGLQQITLGPTSHQKL